MSSDNDNAAQKPLVLFVDDMPDLPQMVAVGVGFYEAPFEAVFAKNGEEARRIVRERRPAAVVLDVNLAGETGITIAEHLREYYPEIPKAVLTAYDLAKTRESADEFGMEVWSKTTTMPELIARVERLLASRHGNGQSTAGQVSNAVRVVAAMLGLVGSAQIPKLH